MKRFLRIALTGIAVLVAVLALLLILFFAEENWRGARDWATCQKELAAKGESLDLRELAPPGKPENDLSKVPIFAEAYALEPPPRDLASILQYSPPPIRLSRISTDFHNTDSNKYPKTTSYLKGKPRDLSAWSEFYRSTPQIHLTKGNSPAQDVLEALSQLNPELQEVDSVLKNPNAYWPLRYDRPLFPYLEPITRMINLATVLALRGTAYLENNQAELAKEDYLESSQICQRLMDEPLMVNYLVMSGVRAVDDAILWEGIRRHAWNRDQLREMESALAKLDLESAATKTWRIERANALMSMKMIQKRDSAYREAASKSGQTAMWNFLQFRPAGWWDQDRVAYCHFSQEAIEAIHLNEGTVSKLSPVKISRPNFMLLYTPITSTVRNNLVNLNQKVAKVEIYRRLAWLACRLEEYRIEHGQYPEKLEELPDLPAHLNQEVLSEQPLRYAKNGEGYKLYSIGWDEKDDGGEQYRRVEKDGDTANEDADWPWPSP